jgi:hypothetical protein
MSSRGRTSFGAISRELQQLAGFAYPTHFEQSSKWMGHAAEKICDSLLPPVRIVYVIRFDITAAEAAGSNQRAGNTLPQRRRDRS